eukprot:TRINITY_DN2607_c0_g2_i1.p1 TRINITY_DN2607_c0_g2~~TRINITY_DN2607_c0_g2_i1.p1  ORF type:complete len:109 (-),score=16.06 TRINITY_DN2607_c0_g2_i1:331-657(-)
MQEAPNVVEALCLKGITLRILCGEDDSEGITWYNIQVEKGHKLIVIKRRFSTILSHLHEPVGKLYDLEPPSKRVFTSIFSHAKFFQSARLNELQTYFNILQIFPHHKF